MPDAKPLSPLTVPKLFWPAAIGLAVLLAAVLLVEPLAAVFARPGINYNEGWNAYHQRQTMQGEPLYGAPPGLVGINYPPISFHLIGLASRLTGDVNRTGRWVALVSLALVAALCGAVVRRLTGSTPLAAYTALNVVVWLAVYMPNRIGMNDPQLLGTVFSVLGLYLYIREPEKRLWLCLSAAAFTVSVFTKHNLLAFPAAVGLNLMLRGRWKGLAVWGGVAACGSALVLALTRWIDGPYFFAYILAPRTRSDSLARLTDYLTMFQLPLAVALFWSLRRMGRSLTHVMALALILSHALALAFVGGDGVDRNIFFDCVFSMVVIGSLVFAEYAPMLAGVKRRGFLLAALLVAPAFGVVLAAPWALRNEWAALRRLPGRSRDFDFSVGLLRSRPGPALCQDLLLCFEAGKPFLYDPYFAYAELRAGRVGEDKLVALAENARFPSVQLNLTRDEKGLPPGARLLFTARFVDALLKRYRVEAVRDGSVVLAANP
jgi:hypothetical protein